MKSGKTLDMTEGPILKKLIIFALPMMFNSVITSLYSTADTIMMGQFAGAAAMAAVGASAHPLRLLINMFAGIGLGVGVCCGNLRGAKKDSQLREAMHTSVVVGFLVGCLVAVVGVLACGPLLKALETPVEILDDAVLYMTIRLAGGPAWLMIVFYDHILYSHGDTRTPMLCGVSSGLLNVGLNVVFVPGLGMGVAGVALASLAAQVLHAGVLVAILFSPKGIYRLKVKELRLRMEYVKNILSVGVPTGLNNIVFSISNVMLQSAINGFGYLVVAGNTAADNLVSYIAMIHSSFGSACLTGASQCYGAKNYKRIDEIARKAILGSVVMIACVAGTVMVFAKPLVRLFTDDPAAVDAGAYKLWFTSWGYMIFAFGQVFAACLRGIRKATTALVCNMAGVTVPRLLWVWFVVPLMHTPAMLYLIYPVSWLISSVVLGVVYSYHRRRLTETESIQTFGQ